MFQFSRLSDRFRLSIHLPPKSLWVAEAHSSRDIILIELISGLDPRFDLLAVNAINNPVIEVPFVRSYDVIRINTMFHVTSDFAVQCVRTFQPRVTPSLLFRTS